MHSPLRIALFIIFLITLVCRPQPGCTREANGTDDASIDRYVEKTPVTAERSLTSLAAYLGNAGKTDRNKARAIYRWIVDKISYDVDATRTGQKREMTAATVLASRTTVCEGFANLYQSLAESVGLTSIKVLGVSKDDPFAVHMNRRSHAWNLVKIDGAWQLVDCTWGAGYLDEQNRFVRATTDYFFLTPPDEFIYGHYPDDSRWQLLDPPVTRTQFEAFISVSPQYFQYHIQAMSHRQGAIQADAHFEITLTVPQDVLIAASLYQDDEKLSNSTFVQRTGENVLVSLLFPKAGKYQLQIFAKGAQNPDRYVGVMEYQVEAKEGTKDKMGFPSALGDFQQLGAYLYAPMCRFLQAGSDAIFDLDVPGVTEILVSNGNDLIPLTHQGQQRFTGMVTIRKGAVMVAAKLPGSNRYSVLLEYSAE